MDAFVYFSTVWDTIVWYLRPDGQFTVKGIEMSIYISRWPIPIPHESFDTMTPQTHIMHQKTSFNHKLQVRWLRDIKINGSRAWYKSIGEKGIIERLDTPRRGRSCVHPSRSTVDNGSIDERGL